MGGFCWQDGLRIRRDRPPHENLADALPRRSVARPVLLSIARLSHSREDHPAGFFLRLRFRILFVQRAWPRNESLARPANGMSLFVGSRDTRSDIFQRYVRDIYRPRVSPDFFDGDYPVGRQSG